MKKILFLMTAVLVIAGCSKSEDGKLTLSANQVSLYSGDTKQVTVNDNATWSSKSEFVAEVSEDGIIKGNHVGKTIITATSDNGEALCEVVVNAKYSTYTEPVLEFGVDKATVYSQDISQKSSNLLRLNLILNGLQHSIHNIVEGNTILRNRHPEKMDYIVSNPPFKLDFSEWRDQVETLPEASERFFAGVPKFDGDL